MSVSLKVILAVVIMVALGTGAQVGLSFISIQKRLDETVRIDMDTMRDMAEKVISMEMFFLKRDASQMSQYLPAAPEDMKEYLNDWVTDASTDLMAVTIFDRKGVVLSVGEADASALDPSTNKYLLAAFEGRTVFSSTYTDERTGALLLYICIPLQDDRVLVATIPGFIFNKQFAEFDVWRGGGVFVVDENGVCIVNQRPEFVNDRVNLVELGKSPDSYDLGSIFAEILKGGSGYGSYTLYGEKRVCSWTPLSESVMGWVIGVTVPESGLPSVQAREELFKSGLYFVGVCSALGLLAAMLLARPYRRLEAQNLKLAEMNEQVRSANDTKSRFLANMSHEMRTPMNAIIGFSELALDDDADPAEARPALEKIHNAGETLLSIINDILDISKIESGKFEIIPVEYDLPSLVNDVVTFNILRLGEKPIRFVLDVDENLPAYLFGDDLRLKQICNNLLSNAFKYTREGVVTWSLTSEREENAVWLSLRVKDTGIGIKPEDIGRLFSDYGQVNVKSNRKVEGTGLGLALTRRMVEMMGGRIEVESEFGRGTTFTARVRQGSVSEATIGPQVAANLRDHQYTEKRGSAKKLIRLHMPYASVLVVDDNQSNLDIAKGMLKPYKMRVDCVLSGQEAVELMMKEAPRYGAVFMDHMMPGMDGLEATKLIRALGTDYARNTPIIALTANAIIGNEEMFLANGFNAFLTKPIDIPRLDAVLRQWVRNKTLETYLETGDNEKTAGGGEKPRAGLRVDGLSAERGLERFGGDEEAYMGVLESYAVNNRRILDVLRGVEPETFADYATLTHGLKGSSRGIGAELLGDLAEGLEHAAKKGDWDYVRERHPAFMAAAERLMNGLDAAVAARRAESAKPGKEVMDPAELKRLAAAAASFDIDGMDAALAQLLRFDYPAGEAELLKWLKEQAAVSGFARVAARLKDLGRA